MSHITGAFDEFGRLINVDLLNLRGSDGSDEGYPHHPEEVLSGKRLEFATRSPGLKLYDRAARSIG
jgi:hypothetical protein